MFLVWIPSDLGSIWFHFPSKNEAVPETLEYQVDWVDASAYFVPRKVVDLGLRYREKYTAYSREVQD